MWAERSLEEMRLASRTWWSTYTFRPEYHARMSAVLRVNHSAALAITFPDQPPRSKFDDLDPEEQFSRRYQLSIRDVTRYIKRLRKGTKERAGVRFRYLVVCEPHTAGLESPSGGANEGMPHFHAFWHETTPIDCLRKADLESEWGFGFSSHRLVDDDACRDKALYLAKYVGKTSGCRVCASIGYGKELHIQLAQRKAYQDTFSQTPLLANL